jgi:hypothetical protein
MAKVAPKKSTLAYVEDRPWGAPDQTVFEQTLFKCQEVGIP